MIVSESVSDTGDGIRHYEIARFSWEHPELFFHHWGKPFYTLLSSPFAQWGIWGSVLFNILCHLTTAVFLLLICRKWDLSFGPAAAFLFISTPVVFSATFAGLTESLFACMLTAVIWLCLVEKYSWAALVLSFLPMVRNEAFFLIPPFMIFFIIKKKYATLLLCGLGTLVYSVAGAFHHGDLLWIISGRPYARGNDIYGSGEWYHFIARNEFIFGLPVFVALIAGILVVFIKKKWQNRRVILLVLAPFLLYFILHSMLWAIGTSSGGLLRPMAAIMPLAILLGMIGWSFIQEKKWAIAAISVFCLGSFYYPLRQYGFGFSASVEEEVMTRMLKDSVDAKIYYLHPLTTYITGRDPFDTEQCEELWNLDRVEISKNMKPGELLLWDSHYARLEGQRPLEKLDSDTRLQLLRSDSAGTGPHRFEVRIYQRTLVPVP